MKSLAFFFLAMVGICNAQFFSSPGSLASGSRVVMGGDAIRYPIENVEFKSEKFQKIFLLAKEQEDLKSRRGKSYFRIIQNIEPGKYLAKAGDRNFLLEIKNGGLIPDDSSISMHLFDTGRVYQYTSILGSTNTIPIRAEREESEREFDEMEFREKLMAGVTYTITMDLPAERCKDCNGAGKLISTSRSARKGDGKEFCNTCKGNGKVIRRQEFEICWRK